MPDITVYDNKNNKPAAEMYTLGERLRRRKRVDPVYLTIVIALVVIGLIVLLSSSYAKAISEQKSSYDYLQRQLFAVLIGVGCLIFFSLIPDLLLKTGGIAVYILCAFLLWVVFIIPTKSEHRWIPIGSFQFQPSEFAKLALIIVMSVYSTAFRGIKRSNYKTNGQFIIAEIFFTTILPLYLFGSPFLKVLLETHLSGAVLLGVIGVSIMLAGRSVKWRYMLPALAMLVAVVVVVILSNSYMLARIQGLLNPADASSADTYQIRQSLYAIGSGGLTGLGLGKSRQKYLYLPEPQNDFIFPIACEELGYIGAVLIIALFGLLIWRGFTIVIHSKDKFRSLVALGITVNFGAQVALNLMVVTGIIPVTGISLPFFSYGGTAIIAQLAEVGMMLHISKYADLEPVFAKKKSKKHAENPAAVLAE